MIAKKDILKLSEYLFGTVDRIYTFISSFLALVSICLTIVLWKFPEKIPLLIIIRDILVICILLLVSTLLLFKYIKRESNLIRLTERLTSSNKRLFKQFNIFHLMVHKFRDDVYKHYIVEIGNEFAVSEKEKDTFKKICHSITMALREIMNEYLESRNIVLHDDLCVTVKLTLDSQTILAIYGSNLEPSIKKKLAKNKRKLWVVTVYRDPKTYEKYRQDREVGIRIYDIEQNSAFLHIFRHRNKLFTKDNLASLGETYRNENPKWKDQYNSAIVAPIRYCPPDEQSFRCFGFIAIDCMNSNNDNIFETEESEFIVGHAADLIANFFLMLSINNRPTEQRHIA